MDSITNGQSKNKPNFNEIIDLSVMNNKYPNSYRGRDRISINECTKKIKNDVLIKLNVPARYTNSSFDNFISEENNEIAQKIRDIVNNSFVDKENKNISMYFWSKDICGNGKTHILFSLVKEYALSDKNISVKNFNGNDVIVEYIGKSIKIMTEYELLDYVRDSFRPNSEINEDDVFNKLNNYDILCIDDVLKCVPSNPEFYARLMFRLIDERYSRNMSLIFVANQSLYNLAKYLSVPATDRLYQITKGYQYEFKGQSYRSK
jgi:DNA replication protein DnaC